jgi:predicted MPP superfamily phosphohydrolase
MKILHIGDFHFRSNKNVYEQRNIISLLIKDLKRKDKIDVVLFSGDLVFNGSKAEDFQKAHEILFNPLIEQVGVDSKNIFICSGNHDIDRTECSEAIIDFFSNPDSKIKKNEDLNKWVETNKKDLKTSVQSAQNYFAYAKRHFSSSSLLFDEFVTVDKRDFEEALFGIITVNSSWMCSGFQEDRNNLLFPIEYLKEALLKVEDCRYKILMLHHPLHYFKEFNYIEIQDLIHREFNLMFSGHVHKERIETDFNSKNGIYSNTTQATLCFDAGEIGYSILNLDVQDLHQMKLDRSYYVSKENSFVDLESVIITIPVGEEKFKQNKLRNKILKKYEIELEVSNQLLLNYDGENRRAFLDTFTSPVLSTRSDAESSGGNPEYNFDFIELFKFEKNYLAFGKDKCGKTSLLKNIQLYHLKNYPYTGVIPFYIDYKDYENVDPDRFVLAREISRYYELNAADSEELINNSKLLLLVDNINISSVIHPSIVEFLQQHPNSRYLICSEYIASRVFIEEIDSLDYNKIYFKNLTRKEIRLYTKAHRAIEADKENDVLEKITTICTQLQLPLNFWTVSLILLIYKKNNDDYSKNLFSVLDACVDEILNKKRFLFTKTDLKFEQYKSICSQIAYYLLTDHRDSEYSSEYGDLIAFIRNRVRKNPRIVPDEKEIFDYLFEVGILKHKGNRYTFRLNGIFEYFLAYYIKEHPEFKDEILKNDAIYLAFKNELELYSGFNRGDSEFLKKVFQKTKTKFDPIIESFERDGTADENLIRKISDAHDFAKNVKDIMVNNPLKHELQDKIQDELNPLATNAEVHVKEIVDTNFVDFELLEKYLSILSRVFKNLDTIEDTDLIKEVFDYIVECYCNLGFYFMQEYENKAVSDNLNNRNKDQEFIIGEEILQLMAKIIPVLIESMLFDGVGHLNLKRIIDDKIGELCKNPKESQYKLFLLYFLYMDLDINAHKNRIDDVFSNITLAPLKVATLFKLNFYLAFKAYKIPNLERFFKNKVQEAQKRIDNKADANEMQKYLADKQKANIVRRHRS